MIDTATRRDRHDELDVRAQALDRVRERIATIKRMRSPVEAPVAMTNVYVAYQLAYGYARLGRTERARELVASAGRGLADLRTDPVHAYLAAAFEARIDQALANQTAATPLPEAVHALYDALGRVERYKVDRFREVSTVLDGVECTDGLAAFARRGNDPRAELTTIRSITDPEDRAKRIVRVLDTVAAVEVNDRPRLLGGCLALTMQLPKPEASAVLARIHDLVEHCRAAIRGHVYARLLVVADHHAEISTRSAALSAIRGAPFRPHDATPLFEAVRVLRRAGNQQELADLLAHVEPLLETARVNVRVVWAGAIASIGAPSSRGELAFAVSHRELAGSLTEDARGLLVRAVAMGCASAPVDVAILNIERLTEGTVWITDSLGTNSHCTRSVIDHVDSLVLGLL